MTDRATRTVKSRFEKTVASAAIGTPMVDPCVRDPATVQYPASTDEIRRLVGLGYRPIGPIGWETLLRAGFLPEGESYLGGRREDET